MLQPLLVPVIMNCNDEYWLPYCLEATRGFFNRYVIYDIGSTDASQLIIKDFVESFNGEADFYVRMFDRIIHPKIQGIFRNSMIAEARSEWYLILDSDEIYTPESFVAMWDQVEAMYSTWNQYQPLYGVVPRIEVAGDLDSAYGQNRKVPHHRLYHRTAIWNGSHPGEVPFYEQKTQRERWLNDVVCYHFHNTERSSRDKEVPKRLDRRGRGTYRPGEAEPFDLLGTLPILREQIGGYPLNPKLKKKQELLHALETGAYV